MKSSASHSSLHPFGLCFVLLVLGSTLSGCVTYPICNSGNCINGQGTSTSANGGRYVGIFRSGLRNGQGTITFSSGTEYVGEWRDGQYNGQGIFTFSTGTQYVGEFRYDKRHGQGTITFPNGNQYVGEFRDSQYNGQGTYTNANGDQYVGEFRDSQFNGQGIYTYANGDQFAGEWRAGQRNGQGTLTAADGSVQSGRWVYGVLVEPQDDPPQSQAPERVADNEEPIEAASGTGFYVSRAGHILTNQHVIDSCQDVQLHANGVRYSVVVIAADRVNDIALLKADLTPPAVFPLSTEPPYLLQNIYAAGYPFGDVVSSAVKVTSGIVSSLVGIGDNVSNLQIDAALQPGNSGGPIIDEYGNAIGIAVAKLDLAQFIEAYETVPENVNFGIRASVAVNLLDANNVAAIEPSSSPLSQEALGRRITDGTVYLSCWMTVARIEEVRSRKALFEGL